MSRVEEESALSMPWKGSRILPCACIIMKIHFRFVSVRIGAEIAGMG